MSVTGCRLLPGAGYFLRGCPLKIKNLPKIDTSGTIFTMARHCKEGGGHRTKKFASEKNGG